MSGEPLHSLGTAGMPKEDPLPPESPNHGFKVEVEQPHMLYRIAESILNGSDPDRVTIISETSIDDTVFSMEKTALVVRRRSFPNEYQSKSDGTFDYLTVLKLSSIRSEGENYGYYSEDRVKKIQQILSDRGVNSIFRNSVKDINFGDDTRNRLMLERDGYYFELHFGYNDRQAEEAHLKSLIDETTARGGEKRTQRLVSMIQEGLRNNSISLILIDKERFEGGVMGFPKVQQESDFTNATSIYVDTYTQVVNAIYMEEGKKPPDLKVVLRPPILSQDTLTEIESAQRRRPITVVEEQIAREVVSFDDIAGQDTAVAEAKKLVLAINKPEVFEKRGVKRPKGILFYGPPGTGKTLIAKVIAQAANADFFEVSAADIGTKWYGESERMMQAVFDRANNAVVEGRKVVIFFDEIDALAPSREGASEATRKVVATLLQNMDGMRANPNVTIIAATNRPQDIDEALKRAGRIDKLISVDLPSLEGRVDTLKVHIEKRQKIASITEALFSQDLDVSQVGQITEGMSQADLANLVNLVLEEKTMAELEGKPWMPIKTDDMIETARKLGILKKEKRTIGFDLSGEAKKPSA